MASVEVLKKAQFIIERERQLRESVAALYSRLCRIIGQAEELAGDDELLTQVLRDSEHLNESPFRLRRAPVREGSVVISVDGLVAKAEGFSVDHREGVISTELPVEGVARIEVAYVAVGYRYQVAAIVEAVPGLDVGGIGGRLEDYRRLRKWLEEELGLG